MRRPHGKRSRGPGSQASLGRRASWGRTAWGVQRLRLTSIVLLALLALPPCTQASPTATGSAPAATGMREPWQDEWDQVVATAKQEGRLLMAGPQGDEQRDQLTQPFEQKYGISVEYLGTGGPELPPRVASERAAAV